MESRVESFSTGVFQKVRKMKRLMVLAIVAVCLAMAAADYNTVRVADKDFLLKQKKIYNLLYYVSQPSLVNPSLYEEGRSYNIEANIDSYTNTAAVKDFLYQYKYGMLPRGELSSVYYPKHQREIISLFHIFYYAKDFDTFYKTALWARVNMNEMHYVNALYTAVIHREDTKYIQLPPPYEMYPYTFFNSEVLEKTHHAKYFGKLDSKKFGNYDVYTIPANYSGWYISREYDKEHQINYFTEDIGLNAYYFFFRLENPYWLKSDDYKLQKYRGEEYLYGHKQLLVRYYLERLSNDLPKVEDFDWQREFYTGYYPTMTFHNGLPLPQRGYFSKIPYYKYKYIKNIQDIEFRVSAAIDSGFILDPTGKLVNIYTEEGLNLLGNLIEGNADSCNPDFYNSMDYFARKILGYNLEPSSSYQIIPSALEMYTTSMRDPAFYRIYQRIFEFYHYRYKTHQKPYNKNEVIFPELKIESFVVDKLTTYFDQFDTSISNGMMVNSAKEAENTLIKVRQYRLNHKPFTFHFAINAERPMKAVVRIFLGPKYDIHNRIQDFTENAKYFYEMDNFIVDLNAGTNKVERNSMDCFFVMPDPDAGEVFYKKVVKSLESTESYSYYERVWGFPARLLLPKGKKEGMPFQFFVYVNPVQGDVVPYVSRVFGNYRYDKTPYGFPLDRPFNPNFCFEGPNMMLKEVLIFHKDEMDLNVTY